MTFPSLSATKVAVCDPGRSRFRADEVVYAVMNLPEPSELRARKAARLAERVHYMTADLGVHLFTLFLLSRALGFIRLLDRHSWFRVIG
jgi:hypothetical protein